MVNDPEKKIIHHELDTDVENPATEVANAIADIEERDVTDLGTMYECVDGVLDHLFSNPPTPNAQMEVEFSYENHRIRSEQNGNAEFMKTE